MTPVNLPAEELELLRKIRRNYKVDFEPFAVRDVTLQLLKVQDLESVLKGKDPFENVSEFPFWIKLWEAAMILADVVTTLPLAPGFRILELGAGLGAPGLAAAAKGFEVTLSDYEQLILDFERLSAAANNLKVEIRFIDWNKPPALAPFDAIIGAEILFREELLDPLLQLFLKLLKPEGSIYLAHDHRRQTLYKFLTLAQPSFKVLAKKIDLSDGEETVSIMLNCLQKRQAVQIKGHNLGSVVDAGL